METSILGLEGRLEASNFLMEVFGMNKENGECHTI